MEGGGIRLRSTRLRRDKCFARTEKDGILNGKGDVKMNRYDPKIHHRRSIRLKGHDYSGGGLYFVTICAHQEFIKFAKGKPFGENDDPIRKIIAGEMQKTATLLPWMKWDESIVMPDHFHALIRVEGGYGDLGRVITGFKAGVTRTLRQLFGNAGDGKNGAPRMADGAPRMAPVRRGGILPVPNFSAPGMRIWHRNYYEMIVWDDKVEKNIREYIRMNPWKCVIDFGNGLRGMGNPALWNADKLGVLCSRNAPKPESIPNAEVYFGGFHSPMEKKILERLLEMKKPVIYCPAWGIGEKAARHASPVREALEENRMLILEMENKEGDLAASEQRNRFVIENADELWVPYVSPGGMLSRLL
jgi:putative transposase